MSCTRKQLTLLLSALVMSGCTTNITVNEDNPSEQKPSSSLVSSDDSSALPSPGSSQSSKAGRENDSVSSQQDEPDSTKPSAASQTNTASTSLEETVPLANRYGQNVYAAFEKAGYAPSQPQIIHLENGNVETVFTASVAGSPVTVYATDMVNADLARKTFESNIANALAQDDLSSIKESGQSAGRTVNVVRNNMSNGNFISAIDTDAPATIYIIDQTPEQLQPMLELLVSLGYPLAG